MVLRRDRLGLSEIISALLLTVIVMGAMSVLYLLMSTYYSEHKSLLYLTYALSIEKVKERLTIAYTLYNSTGLYICIYNYGYVSAKIVSVYINESLISLSSKSLLRVPIGKLVVLHLNVTLDPGIYLIKIISDRGNEYETFIKI